MSLTAIVAIDSNLGIGYKGNILYSHPIDMALYKSLTLAIGNCIVGRKTFETLPNKAKENRVFSVLTRNPSQPYHISSLNDLKEKEYVVIGGSELYSMLEKDISKWFITTHKKESDQVDTWFNRELFERISSHRCLHIYEDVDVLIKMYYK